MDEINDEERVAMQLTKHVKKINSAVSAANSTMGIYRMGREYYSQKFAYTATIDEDAFIFPELLQYINVKTKGRRFKYISERTGIFKHYDSTSRTVFYIGEHKLTAEMKKPPGMNGDDDMSMIKISTSLLKDTVVITSKTAEGIKSLENLLEEMTRAKTVQKDYLYLKTLSQWGDWYAYNLPEKSMDTIFLPPGVAEALTDDIQQFLDDEKVFKEIGLRWHRGYLFYGPPGNGKSSLALALANHFKMDLYSLPLSSVKDDKSLEKSVTEVKSGSFLLLEDVDIFSNSMGREQKAEAPTLAGLLNVLDGVATPNGLVTIMTTNHIDRLDPALIRKGRMDYSIELKAPVDVQIQDMFKRVYGENLWVSPKSFECMADVADVFKRNIRSAEEARMEFKNDE